IFLSQGDWTGAFTHSRWLRLLAFEWRRDRPRVDRQQVGVLRRPLRRQPIERALRVVFLVSDHPPSTNNEIVQSFRSSPKIPNTNHGIIEIWVKNGGKHSTLRRPPWVSQCQVHLENMRISLEDFSRSSHMQPLDVVCEAVNLGGHSGLSRDLD